MLMPMPATTPMAADGDGDDTAAKAADGLPHSLTVSPNAHRTAALAVTLSEPPKVALAMDFLRQSRRQLPSGLREGCLAEAGRRLAIPFSGHPLLQRRRVRLD